jgi:pilus assembly protein CpaE
MSSEGAFTLHEDEAFDIAVAVVDDDPKFRTRLAMQLGEQVRASSFATIDALAEKFPVGTPVVIVLGPSSADQVGLREVELATRSRPELGTIMVVEHLTTEILQQALRAGVKDVLSLPTEGPELLDAVARVADTLTVVQRPTDAAPVVEKTGEKGRVITVFSTKGGAGKSVIASNIATILKRRTDRPVVLVDADLQFGDAAVMLKLTPQHTIVDAVASIDRLDASLLQSLLVRDEVTGIYLLPAPVEPAFADQVGAPEMMKIIRILQTFCEYVVVDTPAYFNDVVLGLLEASDDIVLVAGMDIPNIKNVKVGLQTLRLLNTPVSKVKLVLNRANSKVKLEVAEVERTLQLKADSLIPSDVAVVQSVNKGIPVVIDAPKSGVARSIEQLANLFVNVSDEAAVGRRR